MENLLLRALAEIRNKKPAAIAKHLGISPADYLKIETGKTLLTERQAERLGALLNVKPCYIYKTALQLELLMIRTEMLKLQTDKVRELQEKLKEVERKRKR